ncbi:hypothetical protein E2C01_041758 [Portunus trituberculatus]|uniref:Uncharacterized protein n=1 Tax=Portunus trituberculatus TaxID=210409 RepID=A0A5B7FRI6_PORTR|nr:hypothetical protein [Portunus trituberculatus]
MSSRPELPVWSRYSCVHLDYKATPLDIARRVVVTSEWLAAVAREADGGRDKHKNNDRNLENRNNLHEVLLNVKNTR